MIFFSKLSDGQLDIKTTNLAGKLYLVIVKK